MKKILSINGVKGFYGPLNMTLKQENILANFIEKELKEDMQQSVMIQNNIELYLSQDSEEVHLEIRKENEDGSKNGFMLIFNKNKDLPIKLEEEPYKIIELKDII